MQTSAKAASSNSVVKTEDLRHRRHTLNTNRTFLDRCGVTAQTGAEWRVKVL